MTDGYEGRDLHRIQSVLTAYREGDYRQRLDPTSDGLDPIRFAVNALGASLAQKTVADSLFDALLEQITAMALLDFDHRIPADRGSEDHRALALGLNMLTEELGAALKSRAEAEARYRQAFVSAPIGMVMADLAGGFIAANPAFARMLGRTAEEFDGLTWQQITHPDDVDRGQDDMVRLVRGEVAIFEQEKRYLAKDGRVLWGRVSVTIVQDDAGRFRHTLAQIVDITGQRRTEEELRRARDGAMESDRLKTEFLRNMSHEIRTPMTSIIGMTELALAGDLSADQREYLEAVGSAGESLLGLVDDLLYLSRIEAGRAEPELAPVEPRAVIDQVVAALAPRARQSGLDLRQTLAADLPALVETDGGWLTQILTNLVDNAVKFTDDGSITVSAHHEAGQLVFAVADTGIGVPADKLDLIFDPFAQADGSVSRKHGGTGLGLAISRRLAELLGGRLGVDSTEGVGSTFTVTLPHHVPTAQDSTAPDPGDAAVAVGVRSAGRRVLVAEDNDQNRLLLVRTLEGAGYDVEAVSDGRQAVQAVLAQTFDIVLMDIQMPDMNGLEAIAAIRATDQWPAIPIVAVTAHAAEADRQAVMASGADAFVTKPFTSVELIGAVEGALQGPSD